jgi:drug/metabolite transporter (DMT)-like permease
MPEITVLPIFYATMTAAFFGAQGVLTMRSLTYLDPQTSSMISMGTSLLVFWLLAPFMLRAEYFRNPGMWIFSANGLIHPIFSMALAFEATKRMGATVSATISAIAPLFASIGAMLVLEEHLTIALLMGSLGTVVGIMVLSWKRQGPTKWSLSALFLPIGAAAIRGTNHIIGKFGLEMLPSPYFASLVSFTVSFTGAIILYRYRIGRLWVKLPRQGLKWSGLSGLSIAMGVLCMYTALHTGFVIVVSPIIATFPLFTFFISLLFRQEVLSMRVMLGVVLVVGGVTWISLQ